jgi:hypothetical protein
LEAFVPNLADRLRAAARTVLRGPSTTAQLDLARRVGELERSVRALTDTAAEPVPAPPPMEPAPPPPDGRSRRAGPSWLDLFGALTLLGLLVYGAVAFGYVTFFAAFEVTLEEVGLSYATLLRRAGLNLVVVVALLAVGAAFFSFFGDRRADQRRAAYATAAVVLAGMGVAGMIWLLAAFGAADVATTYFQGCWSMAVLLGLRALLGPMSPSPDWPRQAPDAWAAVRHPPTPEARRARTVGLLVIAGAVLLGIPLLVWSWSMLDDPVSPWPVIIVLAVGIVAVVWGPAGLHRARRALVPLPVRAAAPMVGLLVAAIVLGGAEHGLRTAETVKGLADLRERSDLARLVLDISTPRVCVAWASQAPAPATLPTHELLYLGQADSILALYDVQASRPIRVSSSNVVLVELTAAERTTRSLRTCPPGGR